MSTLKTGPVRWFLGQTVLPEHLDALQARTDALVELRARMTGLPCYGVAQVIWSEQLLGEGVLGISALIAVLPDGEIVSVPGSAVLSQLSLTETGTTRAPVYVHLLDETQSAEGNRAYDSDPRVVERLLVRARLAISERLDGSRGALKLAEFEKNVDGSWRLSADFIPPLLQVGTTPYLAEALQDLETRLSNLEPQLSAQLQDTFLRPERLQGIRKCLAEMSKVQSLLSDLKHRVGLHPHTLFMALRGLHFELCAFHEVQPNLPSLPYRHEELGRCFRDLLRTLQQHLKPVFLRSTHLRFQKANGLFSLSPLPEEAKQAQEVYLLVQRATLHERIPMDEIKLSCTSRLALVHRLVLRGVPFRAVERPPFQHTFGPEVDFYQLQLGEEWNHVLRENSIALYVHPVLEGANVFLFWR